MCRGRISWNGSSGSLLGQSIVVSVATCVPAIAKGFNQTRVSNVTKLIAVMEFYRACIYGVWRWRLEEELLLLVAYSLHLAALAGDAWACNKDSSGPRQSFSRCPIRPSDWPPSCRELGHCRQRSFRNLPSFPIFSRPPAPSCPGCAISPDDGRPFTLAPRQHLVLPSPLRPPTFCTPRRPAFSSHFPVTAPGSSARSKRNKNKKKCRPPWS